MTDTNDGCSSASSTTAFSSCRSISSFFGGKNSNDSVRPVLEEVLDPGHGESNVNEARRSAHQTPMPAGAARPPIGRGAPPSTSSGGRWIGVWPRCCSPTRPRHRAPAPDRPPWGTGSSSPGRRHRPRRRPPAGGSVGQHAMPDVTRRGGASRATPRWRPPAPPLANVGCTRRSRCRARRRRPRRSRRHRVEGLGHHRVARGAVRVCHSGARSSKYAATSSSRARRPTRQAVRPAARRVMVRIGWLRRPVPMPWALISIAGAW